MPVTRNNKASTLSLRKRPVVETTSESPPSRPVRKQPVRKQPVRKQPVRKQPEKKQPVKKQPVKKQTKAHEEEEQRDQMVDEVRIEVEIEVPPNEEIEVNHEDNPTNSDQIEIEQDHEEIEVNQEDNPPNSDQIEIEQDHEEIEVNQEDNPPNSDQIEIEQDHEEIEVNHEDNPSNSDQIEIEQDHEKIEVNQEDNPSNSDQIEDIEEKQNKGFEDFEILAFVDAELTARYIDCQRIKSHKFLQHQNFYSIISDPKISKLLPKVARSYELSLQFVEYKLVTSYGEHNHSEFGVFAVRKILKIVEIEGLDGYLARVPKTIINETNNWSLFGKTLIQKDERIMLGPTSFANHSCQPNATYICTGEKSSTIVKVKTLTEIKSGEEVLVDYGKNYFGDTCRCDDCVNKTVEEIIRKEREAALNRKSERLVL